jgi:hypothetical protein
MAKIEDSLPTGGYDDNTGRVPNYSGDFQSWATWGDYKPAQTPEQTAFAEFDGALTRLLEQISVTEPDTPPAPPIAEPESQVEAFMQGEPATVADMLLARYENGRGTELGEARTDIPITRAAEPGASYLDRLVRGHAVTQPGTNPQEITPPASSEPQQDVAVRLGRLLELEAFAAGAPDIKSPRTDVERKLLEEIRQGNVRVAEEIERIRRQDAERDNRDPMLRLRPMDW